MIHITLGPRKVEPRGDPLGRPYFGWSESMTEDEVYQWNRGRWVLGARADTERYALFSARDTTGAKLVRAAIEIEDIEDTGEGRRAMRGHVLRPGHPVHDRYVGGPALVDPARNPVNYVDSPLDDQKFCACGCGDATTLARDFLPGHDQRAIHARIAQVGTVRDFLDWFDATWKQ
jgi:hypothetical protein